MYKHSIFLTKKMVKLNIQLLYFQSSSLVSPQSVCSSDEERIDRAASPCSSIESDCLSSPCSSPPPLWITNTESDSDEYSPVCSEADPTEFAINEDYGNHEKATLNEDTVCEVEKLDDKEDNTAISK